MKIPGLVEVILRFHDPAWLDELCRAVLCLIGQTHRPLRVLLVTQRFSADALKAVEARLEPYRHIAPDVELDVIAYNRAEGLPDARAALINVGIAAAHGQYLSLLDYDDTLYPNAHALLVGELRASGRAVAYAGIALKSVALEPPLELPLAFACAARAPGDGLMDMFRSSFTPLHGMMLDRTCISADDLKADETLQVMEDYEWQLRLGARYLVSHARIDEIIGDYYYKSDGSNTVPLASNMSAARQRLWDHHQARMERLRLSLVVEPAVQRALGLREPQPGLNIRRLLDGVAQGKITLHPPAYLARRVVPDTNAIGY